MLQHIRPQWALLRQTVIAVPSGVFSFDVQRLASVASCGNANQSNGITVFVRLRSRDARNCHGHIGGRTAQRALGHRNGHIRRDRALCLEEFGVHAKRFDFVSLRIGDKASVKVLGSAGRLRQERRKLTRCTRFGGHDREVSTAGHCKRAFSEVNEVQAAATRRP
jgi:hypothetical protein